MNLIKYHELIKEEFCYKNSTDSSIAKIIGVSDSSVRRYRHKNNIKKLYKDDKWLKEQFNSGLSSVAVSKMISASPSTISRAWLRLGIKEAEAKSKLDINNSFFSEYTEESCYWAGFILADGHIEAFDFYGRSTPNYKLSILLSIKDIDHLKLFANTIGNQLPLVETQNTLKNNKTYNQIGLKISRKKICLDLINNFDIEHTNKSTKEFISDKIPKEYLRHFMRGCIDGDGWVGNKKRCIGICGSYTLCNQFRNIFSELTTNNIPNIVTDGKNGLHRLEIYRKDDLNIIYDFLYKDSKVYLKRKHDRLLNHISDIKI